MTCFNCSVRGHYSDTGTHTPATAYEQQQIRDQVRREREQAEYDNRLSERRTIEPPVSGTNTIEITPQAILPRPSAEKDFISTAPSAPALVSCVRSCTVSRQDLSNACVVEAQQGFQQFAPFLKMPYPTRELESTIMIWRVPKVSGLQR